MSLTIYPAIDMRGGKCVRLLQGDYEKETIYGDSPFEMAQTFVKDGASWVHMVDLDGAKAGEPVNDRFVIQAARQLKTNIQVGGGIRTEKAINAYLEAGVSRVIIGSVAIADPNFAKEMIQKYKERIAIGLDAKDGFVATNGWLNTSKATALEVGKQFADVGCETFIFTDIATDGTLSGPNIEATVQLANVTGKKIIASGGVSSLADLHAIEQAGISGAIVGKAIYEGRFTVKEALEGVSSRAH